MMSHSVVRGAKPTRALVGGTKTKSCTSQRPAAVSLTTGKKVSAQLSNTRVTLKTSTRRSPLVCYSQAAAEMTDSSPEEDEYVNLSQVCAVLGSQWGDEGKGKLVDILAQRYDIIARCQGGANAGHTIYDETGKKFALHQVPSGILNPKSMCVIGNGVVVHLPDLLKEIQTLEAAGVSCEGRIMLSDRAQILLDLHRELDGKREEELAGKKIGTTKRGIGPAYAAKATRHGIRVSDLLNFEMLEERLTAQYNDAISRFSSLETTLEDELEKYKELAEIIKPFIGDTMDYINLAHSEGKKILVEGANATMLDLDWGTYPYVTSSNPSVGGVITGLGLAPNKYGELVGVVKAYTTRVGGGPYPTELLDDIGQRLRDVGHEYGTTTGRPRRCGWLDMVALNYANRINGFNSLNLTKLDCLTGLEEVKIGVAYKTEDGSILTTVPACVDAIAKVEVVYETMPGWTEDISVMRKWSDLPEACKNYVKRIEELAGVKCTYIGVGPGRDAMIVQP